jgi:hypothetical protein
MTLFAFGLVWAASLWSVAASFLLGIAAFGFAHLANQGRGQVPRRLFITSAVVIFLIALPFGIHRVYEAADLQDTVKLHAQREMERVESFRWLNHETPTLTNRERMMPWVARLSPRSSMEDRVSRSIRQRLSALNNLVLISLALTNRDGDRWLGTIRLSDAARANRRPTTDSIPPVRLTVIRSGFSLSWELAWPPPAPQPETNAPPIPGEGRPIGTRWRKNEAETKTTARAAKAPLLKEEDPTAWFRQPPKPPPTKAAPPEPTQPDNSFPKDTNDSMTTPAPGRRIPR